MKATFEPGFSAQLTIGLLVPCKHSASWRHPVRAAACQHLVRLVSGRCALVLLRDTAVLDAFLELAAGLPQRVVEAGDVLLTEGDVGSMLVVLVDGALRVEKAGVPIASITEPGSCVGELSLLLDVPATADVVVSETATVAFVDDARRMLEDHPNLALALARLLAARLQHMTTYLADLQNQYADHDGGLGMVDVVLGSLMHKPGSRSELGSERDPYPEY